MKNQRTEHLSAYDPEPIGRYNVAPGTKVLLLNERDEQLHLDPVLWSYAPGWWDKQPLINARVETAATSRMFKPLWQHGRAICFADGWFEWKKEGEKKQPYFIINPVTGKPVSGNNKGSMLLIWRPFPRANCHFATVERDELMTFGAKLLARWEAAYGLKYTSGNPCIIRYQRSFEPKKYY